MAHLTRAALLAGALFAPITRMWAQLPLVHFGAAGGVSVPTGNTKDAYDRGWHAELLATLRVPLVPLGVRADAVYHRLPAARSSGTAGPDLELYGAELSATWDVGLPVLPITPYVIGGVGYFRQRAVNAAVGGSENSLGWSGGLGVRVGLPGVGVGAFVEGRYLTIAAGGGRRALVPVSLGVTLR